MRLTLLTAIALATAALHGAELANEDKAYGALHGRIAARIQLWPGLAPHETKSDPGKYVFDAIGHGGVCAQSHERAVAAPDGRLVP